MFSVWAKGSVPPKPRHFLREHEDHIAVQKLRRNEPMTATDLAELERIFIESGVAEPQDLERVEADGGLGLFVRSLVGLDREVAKAAFGAFVAERRLSANQIEFLDMVIDHLTDCGQMGVQRRAVGWTLVAAAARRKAPGARLRSAGR